MSSRSSCPFCDVKQDRQIAASDDARAIRDKYPLTDGHTLVVPRRHVASLFELSDEEQVAGLEAGRHRSCRSPRDTLAGRIQRRCERR